MSESAVSSPSISKTTKGIIIAVVVVLCLLAVILGCVFGSKCTVTLEHFYLVPDSPATLDNPRYYHTMARKLTYMDIEVTRTSRYTPYIPNRTGYEFKGWYQDTACTVPWVSGTKVTHDITLYAKWEKVEEAS